MNFRNRICQTLHDEHLANIALLQRIGQLLAAQGRAPPDNNQAVQRLLSDLGSGMASEVKRHFDFEERALFTYLDSVGEGAIGAHLTEEHSILRPLIAQLCEIAHTTRECGFDAESWNQFQRLGAELCGQLSAHIQKEEMALLPLIEENMDSEMETQLYQDYMENA
jgi:hemerythrin-like domain-containing protein